MKLIAMAIAHLGVPKQIYYIKSVWCGGATLCVKMIQNTDS